MQIFLIVHYAALSSAGAAIPMQTFLEYEVSLSWDSSKKPVDNTESFYLADKIKRGFSCQLFLSLYQPATETNYQTPNVMPKFEKRRKRPGFLFSF